MPRILHHPRHARESPGRGLELCSDSCQTTEGSRGGVQVPHRHERLFSLVNGPYSHDRDVGRIPTLAASFGAYAAK